MGLALGVLTTVIALAEAIASYAYSKFATLAYFLTCCKSERLKIMSLKPRLSLDIAWP
ncbi:MAG: hypothetical protein HWD61_04495 [Parachlamydiaceae bacterium]|nr:MAG: hypothetical protein HWD61_04495 [Parachlamydiaceae bacterium]